MIVLKEKYFNKISEIVEIKKKEYRSKIDNIQCEVYYTLKGEVKEVVYAWLKKKKVIDVEVEVKITGPDVGRLIQKESMQVKKQFEEFEERVEVLRQLVQNEGKEKDIKEKILELLFFNFN